VRSILGAGFALHPGVALSASERLADFETSQCRAVVDGKVEFFASGFVASNHNIALNANDGAARLTCPKARRGEEVQQ